MSSSCHEMWATDNKVTLRYRFVGTNDRPWRGQPASHRKVDVAACTILEVVDGRIKRVWRYIDTMRFMSQLGWLPGAPPTESTAGSRA